MQKFYILRFYVEKKIFAPGNGEGKGGLALPCPPFSTALITKIKSQFYHGRKVH